MHTEDDDIDSLSDEKFHPITDEEFKDLHRTLQQWALLAFPNPTRTGCPGALVLQEVAEIDFPFEHTAYDHVKHCSPCLREMLDIRKIVRHL